MRIGVIYRKELVDTLRDRKTLVFMLLIPALAMPLLIAGGSELVQKLQKKQAVEVVKIAAGERTRAAYRELVHEWFLGTRVATGMRMAGPVFRTLLEPEHTDPLGDAPAEIFSDPVAFEAWTRELAGKAREGVESDIQRNEVPDVEIGDELREESLDYYRVTFKGLGFVEFVDPSSVATAPDASATESLPEDLRSLPYAANVAAAIRAREVHGYLEIPEAIDSLTGDDQASVELVFLHDSTIRLSEEADDRIRAVVDRTGHRLVEKRLEARALGDEFLKPLTMARGTDLATKSQKALSLIGQFLPYIIIAFAFLGGMYPAIDLAAGEKERNTLETLVLSPVGRTEIALGKFLVILTTALTAAVLGVVSIALSIHYIAPRGFLEQLDIQLAPSTAVLVAWLAVPPAAAFAGIFLAISIYARSFKEAQNYIGPLQFILILPAMAPMLPGMEMSWRMAAIPLVNVSMLSKDFLKGETNWGYYGLTLASCLALAGLCIAYAIRQFRREDVLFRS